MLSFSENTLQILKSAGWYEGRRIDPSPFKELYSKYNQPFSDIVIEFLAEFGGLLYEFIPAIEPTITVRFLIDPFITIEDTSPKTIDRYETEFIGEPVCNIGEGINGDSLLMSPTGNVYSIFDEFVYFSGNYREAIENLCNFRTVRTIWYGKK